MPTRQPPPAPTPSKQPHIFQPILRHRRRTNHRIINLNGFLTLQSIRVQIDQPIHRIGRRTLDPNRTRGQQPIIHRPNHRPNPITIHHNRRITGSHPAAQLNLNPLRRWMIRQPHTTRSNNINVFRPQSAGFRLLVSWNIALSTTKLRNPFCPNRSIQYSAVCSFT